MSHWTKVKGTKILDKDCFIQAAKELGFKNILQNSQIKGWRGMTKNADVVLKLTSGYDIGLVYNEKENCYNIEADFYGISKSVLPYEFQEYLSTSDKNEIAEVLGKFTNKHDILKQANTYMVNQNEIDEKGNVILELESY